MKRFEYLFVLLTILTSGSVLAADEARLLRTPAAGLGVCTCGVSLNFLVLISPGRYRRFDRDLSSGVNSAHP